MITYSFAPQSSWKGKSPNLIQAFRSNPRLYHEALDVFFRVNVYPLWSRSDVRNHFHTRVRSDVPNDGLDLSRFGISALSLGTVQHIYVTMPTMRDTCSDAGLVHFIFSDIQLTVRNFRDPATPKWDNTYTLSFIALLRHALKVRTLHFSLTAEDHCAPRTYLRFFCHIIRGYYFLRWVRTRVLEPNGP